MSGAAAMMNAVEAAPSQSSARDPIRTVALAFVLSRVWVALWVYVGHSQHPYLAPVVGGWEGVPNWWLNPWTTYDSQHFTTIATTGYEPKIAVFFPLYPLLLKIAGPNLVLMAAWGTLLSNACFAIGLYYLYRLTAIDYTEEIARRAVWIAAFFPMTAFFSAVYTESLFLLLIVATFYCVRRSQWAWAALWATLAALTRNSGLLIFIALSIECYRYLKANDGARRRSPVLPVIATVLPLMAFLGTMLYFRYRFGGMTAVSSQADYFRAPSWPWIPIWKDLVDVFSGQAVDFTTLLNLAATVGVFVLVALHWKRQPASYSVLMAGIILMHLMLGHTIKPYTLGAARYVMTTFPCVQLLAIETGVLASNLFRQRLALAAYFLVCAVMSMLFGQKAFMS